MKRIIIICGLIGICISSQAQKKWTLRECINYAVENNIELRQQSINVKNAELDLSTSQNSRLPDLNASLGQSFSFGRSTANNNEIVSLNSSNTSFGINTSVPIFTGFRIPNEIRMNELNLKAATEGLNKTKENIEIQVVSMYLEVLFKKELFRVYEEQSNLSKMQVEKTNILLEAGKIPVSQLYDIKAQLAKDELNVTTARNDLDLSLLNLSQSLNLRYSSSFDVEEPSVTDVSDNISSILPPDQVYLQALNIKSQIKEAEYKLESSKKNLKITESAYWPSLDFKAGYENYYRSLSNTTNNGFRDQLEKNGSEYISFSLSIPIFNRFQTRNKVRAARLNIESYNLALDNTKLALYKEIQQAYQSAVGAQAKYQSTGKAEEAAEIALKFAQERYDIGKSTVFEFSEAKTKLISSKAERVQAKYDFIFRAKILDFYQGKPIVLD